MKDVHLHPTKKFPALVVSLIGRPNVGKSSLFSRFISELEKEKEGTKLKSDRVIADRPGVTRDRHYTLTTVLSDQERMLTFEEKEQLQYGQTILVDTGGFYAREIPLTETLPQRAQQIHGIQDQEAVNTFFNLMKDHALKAIEESDLVLVVVDAKEGALPFDKFIIDEVRRQGKPYWIVVNKVDSDHQEVFVSDFYTFLDQSSQLYSLSCAHKRGVFDLIENLALWIKEEQMERHLRRREVEQHSGRDHMPREKVIGRLAIIGPPNAGKSTLLNSLIGHERSLVSHISGTTVDPVHAYVDLFLGDNASLWDQSARFSGDAEMMRHYEELRKQNPDVYASLLHEDEVDMMEIDQFMRSDEYKDSLELSLELEDEKETNTEEANLEDDIELSEDVDLIFEGEEEEDVVIEEEVEGEVEHQSYWRTLHVIDTAGIRRKASIHDLVEKESVYRSLRAIDQADVILYVIDSVKGPTHQDRRMIDIAFEKGKSVIIVLNKIDLVKANLASQKDRQKWLEEIFSFMPWLSFCRPVAISARYKTNFKSLKTEIKQTLLVRKSSLPTGELNRELHQLFERHPYYPKGKKGKALRLKYASMIKSTPPTLLLFTNASKGIDPTYRRYLINGLRKTFEMRNTPLHLMFRTTGDFWRRKAKVSSDQEEAEEQALYQDQI